MSLDSRRLLALVFLPTVVTGIIACLPGPAASAGTAAGPNLVKGSAYLVAPANLIGGHYYSSFPHTADFGLTIDGAFALAATGDDDQALGKIVAFLADGGKDPAGKSVNYWTGIRTGYASGGAIGKEALLAEVVGDNPRDFGGRNLIAALDASVCPRAAAGGAARCPAAGGYAYASSVFDQALGVMAQLRAGQRRQAAAPLRYLESLQNADGSYPSLIPGTGHDVDSTAMAVMSLSLVTAPAARADVRSGLAWIASQQEKDGGFPGADGNSVNSAGLAIQALTLRRARYRPRIAAAEAFLAGEQNAGGGFSTGPGQPGANVRASTQALGGAVGTPFSVLRRSLSGHAPGQPGSDSWITYLGLIAAGLAIAAAITVAAARRRRQRHHDLPPAGRDQADPVGRPGT